MTTPAAPPSALTQAIGAAERWLRTLLDRELAAAGLEFAQWTVLAQLGAGDPVALSDLVERQVTGRAVPDAAALGSVLDSLESAGLIACDRRSEPGDRSSYRITESGAAVLGPVSQRVAAISRDIRSGLRDADVEVTQRTLEEIARRAGARLATAT